jgi:DNA-binding response OmpR family regulator
MNSGKKAMPTAMLRQLQESYFVQLRPRTLSLGEILGMCEQGRLSPDFRSELVTLSHKLAGTGATFGFPQISIMGRRLEENLQDHPEGSAEEFLVDLKALVSACQEALHSEASPIIEETFSHGIGVTAEISTLPQVLVVDDDASMLMLMQKILEGKAKIHTCTNSSEAWESLRKEKPALILLDDRMPGGDSGLDLLEAIKATLDFEGIPVLMITASHKPEEVMRGLMAGAADYLIKPVDAQSLTEKLLGRLEHLQSLVLVADDDEAVRELLHHKFTAAGCRVVCAEDGDQAWKILRQGKVALAVVDRMMPGHDGMTLLRMMNEDASLENIPVVFLTARHYGQDIVEGFNGGAADYITKPFHPDVVVKRCLRLLEKPK